MSNHNKSTIAEEGAKVKVIQEYDTGEVILKEGMTGEILSSHGTHCVIIQMDDVPEPKNIFMIGSFDDEEGDTCNDVDTALEVFARHFEITEQAPKGGNRLYCGICGQTNVADTNEAGDNGWEPQVYLSPVNSKRERWIDEVCPHCVRAFCERSSDGTTGLKYPITHPHKDLAVEIISP